MKNTIFKGMATAIATPMTKTGIDYGFFIWRPRVATMADFRAAISAKPDEFLKLIKKTEKAVGMPISAECYKRPKSTDDPRLERFFAWKGQIGCTIHEDFSENTFGPDLAKRVGDFFTKLTPLYNYFNQFKV